MTMFLSVCFAVSADCSTISTNCCFLVSPLPASSSSARSPSSFFSLLHGRQGWSFCQEVWHSPSMHGSCSTAGYSPLPAWGCGLSGSWVGLWPASQKPSPNPARSTRTKHPPQNLVTWLQVKQMLSAKLRHETLLLPVLYNIMFLSFINKLLWHIM